MHHRHDHVREVLDEWRRESPGLDRSAFAVIGRVSRLAQLLQAELELEYSSHGLNGGEFDVLAALRRRGAPFRMTPTALRRALIVTSGGMAKRLNRLETRGLIHREQNPADGRSTSVVLTPAGRRLVDEVLPAHVANENRLLGGLTKRERGDLAGLLEKLALELGDTATHADERRRR